MSARYVAKPGMRGIRTSRGRKCQSDISIVSLAVTTLLPPGSIPNETAVPMGPIAKVGEASATENGYRDKVNEHSGSTNCCPTE